MLIKIAWRNIWRNKVRSLIIMMAVASGLWSGFFLISFYNGLIDQRIRSSIESEISHIQIHHPRFTDDYEVQYYIPSAEAILEKIVKNPRVKAAAGRVVLKGMISTTSGSSGIQINGVMPREENQLTQISSRLITGKYFPGIRPNEMIISEKLMKKLKLKLNAKAILTFQDKDGNLASSAFRITGIYKTVNTPYDEMNVFTNIHYLDTLAGISRQYDEIALLLHSGKDVETLKQQLRREYPELEIKSWIEISPEMNLLVSTSDQAMAIYMIIILLALAFGIINTMLMSVLERTREIGMLLALGMNKMKVFTMILLETIFLALAGSPIGVLAGVGTVVYAHRVGINLEQFSGTYSSFGYSSLVYPVLEIQQIVMMLVMVMVTAILASLLPARKALGLHPADAIRQ